MDWVSIQLMSPASGDALFTGGLTGRGYSSGFHSINVPSEWGRIIVIYHRKLLGICFHSINVPSEWGLVTDITRPVLIKSFHSINVPSEWGPDLTGLLDLKLKEKTVSIQLMSPASGD